VGPVTFFDASYGPTHTKTSCMHAGHAASCSASGDSEAELCWACKAHAGQQLSAPSTQARAFLNGLRNAPGTDVTTHMAADARLVVRVLSHCLI
jgi:hypothetical protein